MHKHQAEICVKHIPYGKIELCHIRPRKSSATKTCWTGARKHRSCMTEVISYQIVGQIVGLVPKIKEHVLTVTSGGSKQYKYAQAAFRKLSHKNPLETLESSIQSKHS